MSRSLAFTTSTRNAKALPKAAGKMAPAHKGKDSQQHATESPEPVDKPIDWSFSQVALHAPPKSYSDRRSPIPTAIRRALESSAGERLPQEVSFEFSRKFGHDLSGVTIHRDALASDAVRSIGANAFTRGNRLFFRTGAYQPSSIAGQALLAHELAHVVQQISSAVARPSGTSPHAATSSEVSARSVARMHLAGHTHLHAGPVMPVSIAADNGVSYEDEEGQVSVLATDQEAAEHVADLQEEANRQRAAAGVTDAAAAAKDEQAQKLREQVQDSVARKQAQQRDAARKEAKRRKSAKPGAAKTKTASASSAPTPGATVLNSSPDLSDASLAEVEGYQRQLEIAIALTPDLDTRLALGDEQRNAQTLASAASNRERYKRITDKIRNQREDNQFLKKMVRESNDLRDSTSVWVEAPIHAYGGAWTRIEIEDFAMTNQYANAAEEAAKAGRFDEADALLEKSWGEWWDLDHRFDKYEKDIQKGGERVVKTAKLIERINRGAANLNPALGFVYNFSQDTLQQSVEVSYGQRESVDYLGNLENAAKTAAISKVASVGSSFAGSAATPYLQGLGQFAGAGKIAVEQGAGILITSGLTDTSPVDAITDPSTWATMLIGGSYAHGGGEPVRGGENAAREPEAAPVAKDQGAGGNRAAVDAAQNLEANPIQPVVQARNVSPTVVDPAAARTGGATISVSEDIPLTDPGRDSAPNLNGAGSLAAATPAGDAAGRAPAAPINNASPEAFHAPSEFPASKTSAPDEIAGSQITEDNVPEVSELDDSDFSDVNHDLGLENPPPVDPVYGPSEPPHTITEPNKAKGVLGEATVPFDRYSGPEWNHIGGGSETASSRANLARQSSYDVQMGQEGTAGNDFLVKNRKTGRLVIGEQKATQGDSFTNATAITESVTKNVGRNIEVVDEIINSGKVTDPAELADLHDTRSKLQGTLEALEKGANGEPAQLPEGVYFEITNVGGEGKQIGKQHIDLLGNEFGNNPDFLEHLLDRTAVRDPELAKAEGRDPKGARGTDADPDIVPAKEILTPDAQDTLNRVKAGKTEKQWKAQKAAEQSQQVKAEKAQRAAAKKAAREQRANEESAAKEQARQAGEKARQEKLKQLEDEKAQKNEPEPSTKKAREQAQRKLEREAKEAGKQAEKAELDKFREARKQQDAAAKAARQSQKKAGEDAKRAKIEAQRQAEQQQAEQRRQAESDAEARTAQGKAKVAEITERINARKAQEQAAGAGKKIENASKDAQQVTQQAIDSPQAAAPTDTASQAGHEARSIRQPGDAAAPQEQQHARQAAESLRAEALHKAREADAAREKARGTEARQTQSEHADGHSDAHTSSGSSNQANRTEANGTATNRAGGNTNEAHPTAATQPPTAAKNAGDAAHPQPGNAEHENTSLPHTNEGEGGGSKGGAALHAANEAAGALRGYDAYNEARKQGKSPAEAAFEASKAYLASTNPIAGAVSTAMQRMQKDEKGEQYYGNDAVDAWLGTIGETGAGYIVPGGGVDQAINTGANMVDAVDDHMQKARDPKAAPENKATARTGTDLTAELTPSRMFSQVIGGGTRAYYDIGRAIGGDTTGVDKYGEDATRGKLGSIIQPWAMAADFVGNLGNSTPSQALDKTIKKTEGTTLKKVGDAIGDGAYELGQSKEAKAGKYGASVQGISGMLSMTSDMAAGKSFEQALNNAADDGKDSPVAKVGEALGDAAFATVQKSKEILDEDIPAARKKAAEMIDNSKKMATEAIDNSKKAVAYWWNSL